MSKFKFLSDNQSTQTFADIYNMLMESEDPNDRSLAETFLNEPTEVIIERYMDDCEESLIQQFRDWKMYNGNWWIDDSEVVECMDNMVSAPLPDEHIPQSRTIISRYVLQMNSFCLEQKCDQLKLKLLEQLMMDRVKHHFITLPDGIEIITYYE